MASKQVIHSFLSCRRIAVVGVSRDPKDFSRAVCRAFAENGYDVVPVNANGGTIEGREAPRRIAEECVDVLRSGEECRTQEQPGNGLGRVECMGQGQCRAP